MLVHLVFQWKLYAVHKPWGASLYYIEHSFALIIISFLSFGISFWSNGFWIFFDCLLQLLMPLHCLFFICNLWILNIVWFPPNNFLGYSMWGNSHYIGLLTLFTHFGNRCQWGRSFRGFKVIWFCAWSFVLKHSPSCLCICCMVGYIEETPLKVKLDKICNEIQVHSHMHSLWGGVCSIYHGYTNITCFCSFWC